MPVHVHGLKIYKCSEENAGHYSAIAQGASGFGGFVDRVMVTTWNDTNTSEYMENSGGGVTHNNLQPYTVIGKFYVHI